MRTGHTKAGQILATIRDVAVGPLGDLEVVRLTERFLELRRQALRDAVEAVIELGQLLGEIRPLVSGYWLRWLDRVGVSPKTARNYEALARLAKKHPRVIHDWKELGTTKLYRVAALPAGGQRKVLRRRAAPELREMTDQEFAVVVAPHVVRGRKVTPDMRAHGLRMRVQAWTETLRTVRIGRIGSATLQAGLLADLEALRNATEAIARPLRGS